MKKPKQSNSLKYWISFEMADEIIDYALRFFSYYILLFKIFTSDLR